MNINISKNSCCYLRNKEEFSTIVGAENTIMRTEVGALPKSTARQNCATCTVQARIATGDRNKTKNEKGIRSQKVSAWIVLLLCYCKKRNKN